MSFSFGFFNEDANKSYNMVTNSVFSSVQEDVVHGTIPGIRDAVKNHFPLEMFETGGDIVYSPVVYGGFDFKKVEVQQNEDSIDKKSDIIPGVYEGGNKVWECSVDLAVLLLQNKHNIISPNSGKVLELGCGHGFPGIAALRLGYQQVVFSDLNGEVIDSATWPNIFLNCPDTMARAMCYSGDWEGLSTELFSSGNHGDGKFEVILSAETLYTEACCKKVFDMVRRHLAPDGCALIASKRFYFGVGGGTYSLQALVEAEGEGNLGKSDQKLTYEVLEVFEDGQSNIREIVALRYR